MPRKRFIQDYELAKSTKSVARIHDLCRGEDDGQISFLYTHATLEAPVKINALASDLGDYPDTHQFMVFADDDAPPQIAQAIIDHLSSLHGTDIHSLLRLVASVLTGLCSSADGDYDPDSDLEYEDEDDNDVDDDEAIYDTGIEFFGHSAVSSASVRRTASDEFSPAARDRMRMDLCTVKDAGFRVGCLGILAHDTAAIISISCRVNKLGLSSEAIKAWQLRSDDYLILLLRYPVGYRNLQQLQGTGSSHVSTYFDVRLGCGPKYKPEYLDALESFQSCGKDRSNVRPFGVPDQNGSVNPPFQNETTSSTFNDTFISRPLVEMITSRLLTLICFRQYGLSWSGAESFYEDNNGRYADEYSVIDNHYFESESTKLGHPSLVTADHYTQVEPDQLSLPLLAMQFALRHFVRCTEFCLVCHRRLPEDVEALKPYVCDRPLCFYQYMTLGFGPSIEHEILSQPLVVDLLISFCYRTAQEKALKSFPNGLSLIVPATYADLASQTFCFTRVKQSIVPALQGEYDADRQSIKLTPQTGSDCLVKVGQWIVCKPTVGSSEPFHCRVTETQYFPTIQLSQPHFVVRRNEPNAGEADKSAHTPKVPRTPPNGPDIVSTPVNIHIYDQSFDDIPEAGKHAAIICLLDTLPDVETMKSYLLANGSTDLKSWKDRISPSALSVLRWIIASNRACILHVDDEEDADTGRQRERVCGMKGWIQFKFAMGAPDKEYRFIKAVRETTKRLSLKHSTLFAWHGSALKNWHSIIREGLRFDTIAHGRAYGNGCYHSLDQATSMGYCSYNHNQAQGWVSSQLKPATVMSLNEIINAPREFVSKSPHLVVDQLDWIQTRYLFVKSSVKPDVTANTSHEMQPSVVLAQDPDYTPTGPTGQIVIPGKISIGSVQLPVKRKSTATTKTKKKKSKSGDRQAELMELSSDEEDDDGLSQASDEEDRKMLSEEIDLTIGPEESSSKCGAEGALALDVFAGCRFKPGSLDHSSLPILPQPSYANTSTSKRLQKDFLSLLKVQETTSARELGWYIDPDKFDNVYQWIVEMHSFEQVDQDGGTLPLATDMEKAGVESVVMEMRFGGSYPMSPPFIRVIRPRFMEIRQGGGGHVTAGGAMCMELLTNNGWTAATSIEAVLLQVRLALTSTDPRPARLETTHKRGMRGGSKYGAGEAVEAYKRACRAHGWTIPADFEATAGAK